MVDKRRVFAGCFLLIMITSFVIGSEWGGLSSLDNSSNQSNIAKSENIPNSSISGQISDSSKTTAEKQTYTSNFYNALWIAGSGLVLLIIFIVLLSRRPKDHFSNNKKK